MSVKIALAGNPNSGKTTLFNALTGSNQFVGNWPGVTVEKKEGRLKFDKEAVVVDLPGIYSLSPYTLEEVVARNYLIEETPDVILNIIDGTNIERNLYLTTQLMELGIPVIVVVNMMDLVEKSGDKIHIGQLSKKMGCEVVAISALKGDGIKEAARSAVALAKQNRAVQPLNMFSESVEAAISSVADKLGSGVRMEQKRFFAVKLLEKDNKICEQLETMPDVQEEIRVLESEFDDDTESVITNERYSYITAVMDACCKKANKQKLTVSDKIDKIVTNRILALPIFAVVMVLVYYISVSTIGGWATDWTNENLFGDGWHLFGIGQGAYEEALKEYDAALLETGEPDPADYGIWVPGIPVLMEDALSAINCAQWLSGLIIDGIVAGVGAVLGFVPQILVLFLLLAFLEGCGYMARVAFIMDRIFRKFGLSGKSFIPMLIGTGCGVPGIMASRTIESDKDRKMTVMTTTFIPCSAKLPVIALIAGAFFNGAWWVAWSAFFVGIAAVVCSGIILKKTKMFAGDPAPFVMELPAYHFPTVGNILRSMWERGWSFIKKAGTIILLSTIVLWFLQGFGWVDGQFVMLDAEQLDSSILARIGNVIAPIFAPLGFGDWKMAVATVTGLIAKENVVATFGILFGYAEVAEDGMEIWEALQASISAAAAYAFLAFNLLCAPCFAAMGAIKREMNNIKWFWFAIGYQTILAYVAAFCIYQIGSFITAGVFGIGTVIAFLFVILFLYLLVRPYKQTKLLNVKIKMRNRAEA